MKDGKEIPSGRKDFVLHNELELLGWRLFRIPEEIIKDVISWTDELYINDDLASDNVRHFIYDPARHSRRPAINILSLRRHEDAVLFKLSWPECVPMFD